MIIEVPLYKLGKERHTLKFVDVDKTYYNVLLVREEQKGDQWELGEVQVLGNAHKLDLKRLAKAS